MLLCAARRPKPDAVARMTRILLLASLLLAQAIAGPVRNDLPQPSEPHTIAMDARGRLFVGDRENNRIQIFDQDGRYLDEWRQFGRPSGIFIANDDTIYVADSESGPDTGAHELAGIRKGIRIGSARDGRVAAFIEDMESTAPDHSGAEGVGADAAGNVYGAVVRRQMLERHVRFVRP
jgi:sugar lactone lactonase YvrE